MKVGWDPCCIFVNYESKCSCDFVHPKLMLINKLSVNSKIKQELVSSSSSSSFKRQDVMLLSV